MTIDDGFSIEAHSISDSISVIEFKGNKILATKNLVNGSNVYGERVFKGHANDEYREWNPTRSKMCAYLKKGGKEFHLNGGDIVLYLGAANGTTVSHVSDITGKRGRIYAIEFSARSLRELIQRLEERENVIPILGDATQPEQYRSLIPEQVDVVYQDVAQPRQAKLLLDNMQLYLKPGGKFYVAIKARSIDVSLDPKAIFHQQKNILERAGCEILDMKEIDPYSDDHVMIVGTWKKDL